LPWHEAICYTAKDKEQTYMQQITPFLWFDDQAEEAVNFYISIFVDFRSFA